MSDALLENGWRDLADNSPKYFGWVLPTLDPELLLGWGKGSGYPGCQETGLGSSVDNRPGRFQCEWGVTTARVVMV